MLQPLLQGLGLGLALSLILGPILFTIVGASLRYGWRAGVFVAAGIWLSDILFVLFSYFALAPLQDWIARPAVFYSLGIGGGLLLVGLGIHLLQAPAGAPGKSRAGRRDHPLIHFSTGFLVNTLSPFTTAFWLTVTGSFVFGNEWSPRQAAVFYGAILFFITTTDVLKALGAEKLQVWMRPRYLHIVQQISAWAIFLSGLVMIARLFFQ
jgi:threonine/homoserine/homoserine lactone efflux protein